MVAEVERLALEQFVARLVRADVDAQPPTAVQQPEAQPRERGGQARGEREVVAVVAHAAEAGHRDQPGAGQRGEVQAIGGVAREVVQVDEGRLAEVLVGEVEVPDLGGDDRLDRTPTATSRAR